MARARRDVNRYFHVFLCLSGVFVVTCLTGCTTGDTAASDPADLNGSIITAPSTPSGASPSAATSTPFSIPMRDTTGTDSNSASIGAEQADGEGDRPAASTTGASVTPATGSADSNGSSSLVPSPTGPTPPPSPPPTQPPVPPFTVPWYVRNPPWSVPFSPPMTSEGSDTEGGEPGNATGSTTSTLPMERQAPTTAPGGVTSPPTQTTPTTLVAPFRCDVALRPVGPYGTGTYEVQVSAANASSGWLVIRTSSGQQSLGVRLPDGEGSVQVSSPTAVPTALVYATYEARADQLGCRTPA